VSDELDDLFRLPLDEFTAARNALAKRSGKDAGAIRALVKPPLAAWAVNQLHWKDRRTWDALIEASEHLRRASKAALSGRAGDVRAAGTAHDEAVRDALKSTLAIVAGAGHPATDATRQQILNTLRALPANEPPGRLTRVLQPGAFELLTKDTKDTKDAKDTKEHAKDGKERAKERAREAEESKANARALTQAREAAASTERTFREAEQAARRHEFEIARATRDEERGEKAVREAREALAEAKRTLEAAERDQADASARRRAAETASRKAAAEVERAGRAAKEAAAALKKQLGG
jgi:hypothetical protein